MSSSVLALSHTSRQLVPNFWLYGEQCAEDGHAETLHIEDIPSRSRKYLWNISAHRHVRFCQCVFLSAGPAIVELEGNLSQIIGPAAILLPAGTIHGFRFRSETRGYVLSVDLDRLLAIANNAHQAPIQGVFSTPRVIDLRSDSGIAGRATRMLELLLEEFRQPKSLTLPIVSWLACGVLWMLGVKASQCIASDSCFSQDFERLQRFRRSIESHYLRHWSVARYARQLSLSESSLNRLCRNLTGQTAFALIRQRMALEAQRRLLYAPNSVTAVAGELGFKDAAYFCRFFRRYYGMSPREYRRSQLAG